MHWIHISRSLAGSWRCGIIVWALWCTTKKISGLCVSFSVLLRLELLFFYAVILGRPDTFKEAQLWRRDMIMKLTDKVGSRNIQKEQVLQLFTLYMTKLSRAKSSSPARTARATTHPGTGWVSSEFTQITFREAWRGQTNGHDGQYNWLTSCFTQQ